MKRPLAFVSILAFAVIAAGWSHPARALDKISMVIPRDSVFVLNFLGARDDGLFKKYGIDLNVDPRPFAGFLASLPSKQTLATTYSGMDAIEKMNEGLPWQVIGGGLTVIQQIYVRKDSPIKTVADLRGKTFGTWSTGAGAYKAARAAMIDGYGIDVAKETKLEQMAAPALLKFLENGTVDAMINISSLTVRAASQPDKFRSIFAPNEFWRKKTGYPIVWAAPLVAWKSWVDADPKRARNFSKAVDASFRWLADPAHLDAAVKKYGQLAGVTRPAEVAVYRKWLAEGDVFLSTWDKKAVDAQWKFLDVAKKAGVLNAVPPEAQFALIENR
ncbi:MAG: ABC transporter substrate-binding protein [Stellaceae bacterium]